MLNDNIIWNKDAKEMSEKELYDVLNHLENERNALAEKLSHHLTGNAVRNIRGNANKAA